jgi:hypothetical protein
MAKTKKIAPINFLFNPGYKISYFCEDLSKYVENQLKTVTRDHYVFKMLKTCSKKYIFHIEMLNPFCLKCFSKSVVKNGIKERKLYIYDK